MAVTYNASVATDGLILCLDAANKRSFSPNLLDQSTDLYSWNNGTAIRCTLTRDQSIEPSPARGIPMRMDTTGTDPYCNTYGSSRWNTIPVTLGQTFILSVYARGTTTIPGCGIYAFGADSLGRASVDGSYLEYSYTAFAVEAEWQRYFHMITITNPEIRFLHFRLDGPQNVIGSTVWWDGMQVELDSTMTPFNPIYNPARANWYDLSNNGNHLTIYGNPKWNPAGYFEFSDLQITEYMMRFPFNNPTDDVTYSCWFRSRFPTPTQTPFTYSVGGNNEMLLFTNNSSQLAPHIKNVSYPVDTTDMKNRWVNITWTRERATGLSNIYRNGELIKTQVAAIGAAVTTGGHLIIGQEADSAGGGFHPAQCLSGDFSRLDIYNRVLSPEEVAGNFNALRGRYGI